MTTSHSTPTGKLFQSIHDITCGNHWTSCDTECYAAGLCMVEAHMARDHVSDWKPYFLWFPRRWNGKWYWRITVFRRQGWNAFDKWYEYSLLPLPGDDMLVHPTHKGDQWL
jgi:hypothetical protein